MSSQSNYHRNGTRSFFPSLASINSTEPGQIYAREMEHPFRTPRPVEIDMNNSRTLPSPSASATAGWDSNYPPLGFSDLPYGPPSMAKMQQIPSGENQIRGSGPDPLVQWFTNNDGPWNPITTKIPENVQEERGQSRQTVLRNPMSYPGGYRQHNPSEVGSVQFGFPHSDSGYGTRRSVGNTSVFSADVTERDQDCQSLAGHVAEFQPFHQFNDMPQQVDGRANDSWTNQAQSSTTLPSGLVCATCNKSVKTQSELKKHDLRHRKPFVCKVQGCPRTEGFSTTNDLDRHTKSKHPSAIPETTATKKFRCHVLGCKSKDKLWPRLDNFRSHLKRVHQNQLRTDEDYDDMIRRAEFWERTGLSMDPELSLQRPTLEQSRPSKPVIQESLARQRRPEPAWKPLYPEVIEPSQDLIAPKIPQLEIPEPKATIQEEKSLPSEAARQDPVQDTVQPLDVFRPNGRIHEPRIALDVLLAPAGLNDSANQKADGVIPHAASKTSPQGKTPKQNEVSAGDATLTEAIKTALAGAKTSDLSNDRAHHDLERSSLPNGKVSPRGSWPGGPNAAMSSTKGSHGHINPTAPPTDEDAQAQKKALEVLRVIRDLGYIVQKDPSHSPKIQNPGSIASNKSENQVTCQTCKKFKGRPCELKKHMKRHERPYGCTFLTCNKVFGSKNDWKRHENSQHFHLETWRCDEERPEGGACAKVCYRRQTFQDHLKKEHQMSDVDAVKTKLENCRIGRNCQARFWCGFCNKLIDLKKKGLEAWTERFDHIDDHFMGRNCPIRRIQDWIPMDGKPKDDLESPHSLTGSPDQDSSGGSDHSAAPSPDGNSPEAAAPGGSSAHAGDHPESSKRRRAGSDDESGPAKRPRTAGAFETTVYCCQCNEPSNPTLVQKCFCDDNHQFCGDCRREVLPQDKS